MALKLMSRFSRMSGLRFALASCNFSNSSSNRSEVPVPITTLTEEEQMMKETGELVGCFLAFSELLPLVQLNLSVSRFAREQVQPLVREMDEKSAMDKSLIKSLFDQGVSDAMQRPVGTNNADFLWMAFLMAGKSVQTRTHCWRD